MRRCLAFLTMLLATASLASTASAATVPDRPVVQELATEAGGEPRVSLAPDRFDPQVARPGSELRFPLTVRNTLDVPVTLRPYALPIEGSSDPDAYARAGSSRAHGAEVVEWVAWPGFGVSRDLPPGAELQFPVAVSVPADARPGSYAVGFAVSQRVGTVGSSISQAPSSHVRLALDLASVAVLRVPGDAAANVTLLDVDAPRLIWADRTATFRARVRNSGDTDLVIDGQVTLGAFLASASRSIDARGPEKGYPALPGGVRELEMRWNDPPLIGWFEPELVVVGGKGSGVRVTDELPIVFVLPPWWLVALLVAALWLPLRARRRRRADETTQEAVRARAKARVEQRLRRDEAKRRAAAARRHRK